MHQVGFWMGHVANFLYFGMSNTSRFGGFARLAVKNDKSALADGVLIHKLRQLRFDSQTEIWSAPFSTVTTGYFLINDKPTDGVLYVRKAHKNIVTDKAFLHEFKLHTQIDADTNVLSNAAHTKAVSPLVGVDFPNRIFYFLCAKHGDLESFIKKNKIDDKAKLKLCLAIARTLKTLRVTHHIVHQDIKPGKPPSLIHPPSFPPSHKLI